MENECFVQMKSNQESHLKFDIGSSLRCLQKRELLDHKKTTAIKAYFLI